MPSREGPKASVVLSCHGCQHHTKRPGNWGPAAYCLKADMQIGSLRASKTQNWCPLLPGKLVAVPLSIVDDCNVTRNELINSARALGQEIPHDKG